MVSTIRKIQKDTNTTGSKASNSKITGSKARDSRTKLIIKLLTLLICLAGLTACSGPFQKIDGGGMMERSYARISQEEAREMMTRDDGHIIVDVRRQDEYDSGHIPGAVCIPNESITKGTKPEGLPDLDQVILIYCRSGKRAKEAADKLFNTGYTHIYEFGGILDWKGEVVKEEASPDAASPKEKPEEKEDKQMRIRVSDSSHSIVFELNDTISAKSFYSLLPLDAEVENYGSTEKIFYMEQEVDTRGGLEGGGEAGGLALFSPWGNIVMYYGKFSQYPGLYLLGQAVEGTEQIKDLSGMLHVEAVE
ncbi:MAG: hypothetical protein J6P87_08330 [Lachnospiraceae bacterium]|nr:hypothetical protein [Lachnospiraceae bacterium]